ncbi:uncharacterized protein LOC120808370 [Gasterosteus aculeatus]
MRPLACRMAAALVHALTRLLLFAVVATGANGGRGRAEGAHEITVPCGERVCLHTWKLKASRLAVVAAAPQDGDPECVVEITDSTAPKVYCCSGDSTSESCRDESRSASPQWDLVPGKTLSLQCLLLRPHLRQVRLTWVDEAGAEVREDSRHRVQRASDCNVTLTVTSQGPGDERLRCRATAGEEATASPLLWVRVPVLKGNGRGVNIPDPGNQGGGRDVVGGAVGAGTGACVVLAASVTLLVVRRRRTRNRRPDGSHHTTSINNAGDADDVVYADMVLPVVGDPARVPERESTEYASVRYT